MFFLHPNIYCRARCFNGTKRGCRKLILATALWLVFLIELFNMIVGDRHALPIAVCRLRQAV